MRTLCIDLGYYSVKCADGNSDRNGFKVNRQWEYFLEFYPAETYLDQIEKIFEELIPEIPAKSKVIVSLPNELNIHRFVFLPIKNRKKAEMMLPFQIEEDIPQSLAEVHMATGFTAEGKGQRAHASVINRELFHQYFERLFKRWTGAMAITTDASAYSLGLKGKLSSGCVCILDIGHQTTKAFYFNHGKLIATHRSFVAGKNITDAISITYDLDSEQAAKYKHENAFVLTPELLSEVDEQQKEFSLVMHNTLNPLVKDIARWNLGLKMSEGLTVESIYLTGGSSKIQNLENYFSALLQTRTIHLKELIPQAEPAQFFLSYCLGAAQKFRAENTNYLTGVYQRSTSEEISFPLVGQIAARSFLLTSLITAILMTQQTALQIETVKLDKKIEAKLKEPLFKLNSQEIRRLVKKPENIASKLKDQKRSLVQEVSSLQASTSSDSLPPLFKLVKSLSNKNVEIHQLSSDGDTKEVTLKIKALEGYSIAQIEEDLKKLNPRNLKVNGMDTEKTLEASFIFE